jgi:hypothetical protein
MTRYIFNNNSVVHHTLMQEHAADPFKIPPASVEGQLKAF